MIDCTGDPPGRIPGEGWPVVLLPWVGPGSGGHGRGRSYVALSGAGHYLPFEQPERFRPVTLDWLAQGAERPGGIGPGMAVLAQIGRR